MVRGLEEFSYYRGALRNRSLAYLALSNDELSADMTPGSFFVAWYEEEWYDLGVRPWSVAALAVARDPIEEMVAIGDFGQVLTYSAGQHGEERVETPDAVPNERGRLRCGCSIEGLVYVAGMDRQVYRRVGPGSWESLDGSIRPSRGSSGVAGFEAIDGHSGSSIYAAGWDGEIFKFDGSKWHAIASPVNTVLTCLCCVPGEGVYAGGRGGTLLRGSDDRWEVVEQDLTEEDFWDLAWFRDGLFLSTLNAVYEMRGGRLARVDFGSDLPATCYALTAEDGMLWSIGSKDIMAFDGNEWYRID